ncbi:MAG TPA: DnaJ domain-containing protein [Chthoniobacterales bacterium]|nr:DnaJ domain-containing protein [Chthoniobacterales bacterium]
MTDYFALLDLPRRPWLDEEEVKRQFHSFSRTLHPDAQNNRIPVAVETPSFHDLNEAYGVLRDPRQRLRHFLALVEGPTVGAMAGELQDLFASICEVMHAADRLLERHAATQGVLARSLLKAETVKIESAIGSTLKQLNELYQQALSEVQKADARSTSDNPPDLTALAQINLNLTFLVRWLTQLEEKKFLLSNV